MFQRLTYDYIDVINKTTIIFSLLSADEIADQLIEKLIDLGCSPQVNDKKWKFTFTLTQERSDQEQESLVEATTCTVQVKFMRMGEDSDQICIDFTRLRGCAWLFYEQFDLLKGQLSDI